MKKLIPLALLCHFSIYSIGQNSTNIPAGDYGIGTTSPATKLHVHNPTAIAAVGNEQEPFRVTSLNGNNSQFKFVFRRHTAGADWLGVASRLQFATDNVKQAFIEFNPGGHNPGSLALGADDLEIMRLTNAGSIGVGTIIPQSKMHILGGNLGSNPNNTVKNFVVQNGCGSDFANIEFYGYRNANGNSWLTASTRIEHTINGVKQGFIEFNPLGMTHGMALGTDNTPRLYINSTGQVGIGTTAAAINNTDYKLYVETGIRTRKVKVDTNNWPDYVFENEYNLMPLAGVEKFIQQHGHLPEIPSAEEVKKNGIDLGENQASLLKKIEELTLYMIEQNKTQQTILQELKQLKEENKRLKELVEHK
jgi:hypothetical protein